MTSVNEQYLASEVLYMSPEGAHMMGQANILNVENLIMNSTTSIIKNANPQFINSLSAQNYAIFVNSIVLAQTHFRRNWPASNMTTPCKFFQISKKRLISNILNLPLCISKSAAETIAYSNTVTWLDLQCPHADILKCRAVEVYDKVSKGSVIGPGQSEAVFCAILQIMAYRQGADPLHPPVNIPNRSPPN